MFLHQLFLELGFPAPITFAPILKRIIFNVAIQRFENVVLSSCVFA